MQTTTHVFPKIEAKRSHSGHCPVCGRAVRRSRTFWHTVNPFNRRADGTVRTPAEVRVEVEREADAWVPDFTHATCRAAMR